MEPKPTGKPEPPPPDPPKEGLALFQEKFFQIRRAAFQTGCIAVIAHFLIAFMVVVGLYQITIASMYFSECPANDLVPQFLIVLGCICILDMVFAVLAIIPMEISTVFFYSLLMIRIVIIAAVIYGFKLLHSILDREMTHFCVDILTDTLHVTLVIFTIMLVIYFILLIFNVITAVALMRYKRAA